MTAASLSVIIPVYNGVRFLPQLFGTLCAQHILGADADIPVEVLVIDDGSTDGTPEAIREYVAKYPNVRYLRQENSGQAVARNLGLDNARMKYVYMMDCDDTLVPDTLLRLVRRAEKEECEVLRFGFREVDCGRKDDLPPIDNDFDKPVRIMDGMEFVKYSDMLALERNVWTSLFRRDFLNDNKLRFKVGMRTSEDYVFNINMVFKARRIAVLDVVCLNYIVYPNSNYHNNSREHFRKKSRSYIMVAQSAMDLKEKERGMVASDAYIGRWLDIVMTESAFKYLYPSLVWMDKGYGELKADIRGLRERGFLNGSYVPGGYKEYRQPYKFIAWSVMNGGRHPFCLDAVVAMRAFVNKLTGK